MDESSIRIFQSTDSSKEMLNYYQKYQILHVRRIGTCQSIQSTKKKSKKRDTFGESKSYLDHIDDKSSKSKKLQLGLQLEIQTAFQKLLDLSYVFKNDMKSNWNVENKGNYFGFKASKNLIRNHDTHISSPTNVIKEFSSVMTDENMLKQQFSYYVSCILQSKESLKTLLLVGVIYSSFGYLLFQILKNLNTVIECIRNINSIIPVNKNSTWKHEFTGQSAFLSKIKQQPALLVKNLYVAQE